MFEQLKKKYINVLLWLPKIPDASFSVVRVKGLTVQNKNNEKCYIAGRLFKNIILELFKFYH